VAGPLHAADSAPAETRPPVAAAGSAAAQGAEPATLRLVNRDIVTFRAALGGASPARRAERARQRFRELPESTVDLPLQTLPVVLD
jgi:hypothetical protein